MSSLAIGMGVSAAAGVASSAIGAHAAGKAASTQAAADMQAAELQHEDAQAALGFNEQEWLQAQANMAPWLQSGSSALVNLDNLLGILPPSFSSTAMPGQGIVGSTAGMNPWMTPEAQLTVPNGTVPFSAQGSTNMVPLSGLVNSASTPVRNLNGQTINPNPGNLPAGFDPSRFDGRIRPELALNDNGISGESPGTGIGNGGEGQPGTGIAINGQPVSAGQGSGMVPLSSLVNPSLGASGSLLSPWPFEFQAPTDVTEQNDPGYQFRLQQGETALDNSAAARGALLSGGTLKAGQRYAQDYASNEYQNVYNRGLTEYQQAYNQFQNNQTNIFNRLASMAGMGQTSAAQLNSTGTSAAFNAGNILLGSGAQIGNSLSNAGAARSSGYVGGANAISGGLNNLTSLIPLYSLLQQYGGGGGIPGGTTGVNDLPPDIGA